MATIQDQVASLADLAGRLPAFVQQQDRLLLMAFTAAATAAGVGAVTRNHELGPLAKVAVGTLIFLAVMGLCLLGAYGIPVLVDLGQHARSAGA